MFSAFKKLTSKNENAGCSPTVPESVGQSMSESLKKRFARGVQYNMKVIIKGDRNVGKSCLLERLQGKAFLEQYSPTEQIQVASIQWSYKATDDIVKVEVWDVVDRGKQRPKSSGLKLGNSGKPSEDVPVLDAEFLDVYKGTHCVIMMMDITKAWTFDYVCRELPKIPKEIPVLLLGNHCDMGHHRVISKDQIQELVEELSNDRPTEIIYSESSMRNGFGLRLLHKFLGIPFLYLQRATLESALKKNESESEICRFEVNEFNNSDESNYAAFLDNLISKRRPNQTPVTSPMTPESINITSPMDLKPTKSIIIGAGHPIIIPDKNNSSAVASTSIVNTAKMVSPPPKKPQIVEAAVPKSIQLSLNIPTGLNAISNVDEFCPDGDGLDKSFLDDSTDSFTPTSNTEQPIDHPESDSDSEAKHNPLVSRFDDDCFDAPGSPKNEQKEEKLKKNPLSKKLSNDEKTFDIPLEEDPETIAHQSSLSSLDIENSYNTNFSIDGYDTWTLDTKLRRSPEGGEDIESTVSSLHVAQDVLPVEKEKKSKDKDKDKDKEKKKKKKKDKDRDKDEHREKKKKDKKKKDNVEDFLNEMKCNPEPNVNSLDDEAYEAI